MLFVFRSSARKDLFIDYRRLRLKRRRSSHSEMAGTAFDTVLLWPDPNESNAFSSNFSCERFESSEYQSFFCR